VRIAVLVLVLSGCAAPSDGEPCAPGRAPTNAGDCVPGCMLDPAFGEMVFDEDGVFTGYCSPEIEMRGLILAPRDRLSNERVPRDDPGAQSSETVP